jgi:hypothetical protein
VLRAGRALHVQHGGVSVQAATILPCKRLQFQAVQRGNSSVVPAASRHGSIYVFDSSVQGQTCTGP